MKTKSSPWAGDTIKRKVATCVLLLFFLVASARPSTIQEVDAENPPERQQVIWPLTALGKNAVAMFSGCNSILHLSAIAGTFLIVHTGLDTGVHNFFARHTFFEPYSGLGVIGGAMMPMFLGGGLCASGLVGGSPKLAAAGSAVLQASLFALCYTTALKALTGRPHPEHVVYPDNSASARFDFGFLRQGVFWGWPSGHMLANTAAVTSLLFFFKDQTMLHITGVTYLGYLFLSIAAHGKSSMHWFSDEVAGTLMGYAIGSTVGRNFRRIWENKKEKEKKLGMTVKVMPGLFVLSLNFNL